MIVDGVLDKVELKRRGIIDRLLLRYYSALFSAEEIYLYLEAMPPCEERFELMERYLHTKYPYLGNQGAKKMAIIAHYNNVMKAANKHLAKDK